LILFHNMNWVKMTLRLFFYEKREILREQTNYYFLVAVFTSDFSDEPLYLERNNKPRQKKIIKIKKIKKNKKEKNKIK